MFEAAKENESISGIPAGITTAQAIHESNYGKQVPIDKFTSCYSYNLFGIKAHKNENFVTITTHEYINGVRTPTEAKFVAYSSFEESINGRSDFLHKQERYRDLFSLKTSKEWAKGLQDKGYATDPEYANKLIKIINQWNLE